MSKPARKSTIVKIASFSAVALAYLAFTLSAFAQTSTSVPAVTIPPIVTTGTKGGTSSALPNAGATEITTMLLLGGAAFFVFGTMKLIWSFRSEKA